MRLILAISLIVLSACAWSCRKDDSMTDPTPMDKPSLPVKTNPTKVYMHYMPWFHSKEFSGYWGSHWRMANKNPDNILPNGQREIASYYYPLIGPYDSGDPDAIDYHLLLMKYAGVDGVLIDWYGSSDILDYGSNLRNSDAIIEGVKRTGLGFSIVYEDNTAYEVSRRKPVSDIEAAQADMKYIKDNYLTTGNFIEINDQPLLLTFGPRHFTSPSQWTQILGALGSAPAFYPLWHHDHRTGSENTSGEFAWVDFSPPLTELMSFYSGATAGKAIGSVFPGFHDYYPAGGWGDSYGYVAHDDGITFSKTINLARSHELPYLQLVTWNDFGEGTMIEPTVEFQYQYLEAIQDFTGVEYRKTDLELIFDYYIKRKEYAGDTSAQTTLDKAFDALNDLQVQQAKNLLEIL